VTKTREADSLFDVNVSFITFCRYLSCSPHSTGKGNDMPLFTPEKPYQIPPTSDRTRQPDAPKQEQEPTPADSNLTAKRELAKNLLIQGLTVAAVCRIMNLPPEMIIPPDELPDLERS
jgi:hypothetical protein